MPRFEDALDFVLDREGRSDNETSGDPDTSFGITQPVYDEWRRAKGKPMQDVDIAEEAELTDIYRERFWLGGKCDQLPEPIDLLHFDSRVNCGEGTANRMLQTALNVGIIDGLIGARTLAAMGVADVTTTFARYCNLRITRYIVIAASKPQKRKNLRGWLRRVGHLLMQV